MIYGNFSHHQGDQGRFWRDHFDQRDMPRIIVRAPEAVLVEPATLLSGVFWGGFCELDGTSPAHDFSTSPARKRHGHNEGDDAQG